MKIYTIGHSTRTIDDLIAILKRYGIEIVIDIRKNPHFKHAPQFDGLNLEHVLVEHKISYIHLPELGGFQNIKEDSQNYDFKNTSQAGFPDYMQTGQFENAIQSLLNFSQNHKVVLMCAEANPNVCHRQMICDCLTIKNIEVEHIQTATHVDKHELTKSLKIINGKLTYLMHS